MGLLIVQEPDDLLMVAFNFEKKPDSSKSLQHSIFVVGYILRPMKDISIAICFSWDEAE